MNMENGISINIGTIMYVDGSVSDIDMGVDIKLLRSSSAMEIESIINGVILEGKLSIN
jgi:hypothetical protein